MRPTLIFLSAVPVDYVDENSFNCSTVISLMGRTIVLTVVCPFPVNRIYYVGMWAFRCFNHPLSDSFEMSTHKVQIQSVSNSSTSGEVVVTGKYANGSDYAQVAALLLIAYSQTNNDSEVHYYLNSYQPKDQPKIQVNLTGLPGGTYAVAVFVVNEEGLPFHRAAGVPKHVQVADKHSST